MKKYIENFNADFEKLWSLKPENKSSVLAYDRETKQHKHKTIYRSFKSYGNSPKYDPKVTNSYMFSGSKDDKTINGEYPQEVKKILAKLKDKYNQVVVNWYEPGDFIEMHSDCDAKMKDEYKIAVVNLLEGEGTSPFHHGDVTYDLSNNEVLIMDQNDNRDVKHGTSPINQRRISITARQIEEHQNGK